MMRLAPIGPVAAIVAMLMSGCALLGDGGDRGTATFNVGDNALGEPCRVVRAKENPLGPASTVGYGVFCGAWEEPSAQIFLAGGDAQPMAMAAGGAWRAYLDGFLRCEAPRPTTILDDAAAAGLDCALQKGGWPYQALAARVGGEVYLVDAVPVAIGAAERAVGVLSGRVAIKDASEPGSVSAEMARLESRLAQSQYSIGDLQRYFDLLRLAQYYNFQGRHAEAEKRYREALALQQKAQIADPDSTAFALMHIALELSNQERFGEAEAMFAQTEAMMPDVIDPTLEPQLISYRALHFANQRAFDPAAKLARQATQRREALGQQAGLAKSSASAGPIGSTALSPGDDDAVLMVGNISQAQGDIVQSKYIEGAMLHRGGRPEDADRVLEEAKVVFYAEPTVPRRWLPEILSLQAEIAAQQGDYGRAEQLLREAIGRLQALFFASRSEANAYLALAQVYEAGGRRPEAFEAYRRGFGLIRQQNGGVSLSQAFPFFRAALAEAERDPPRRQALYDEMFEVAQLVQSPVTAQTIALTAARLATGDQGAGQAIRALQDARRQRDQLKVTLARAQTEPGTLPQQLAAMEAELKSLGEKVGGLERQVQAAAPRYNQIIDAPVSAPDVVAALRPGEAIFNVLPGANGSVAFFIDGTGVAAYEIGLTEAEARRAVGRLREAFDGRTYGSRFDVGEAFRLYTQLFGPVQARLQGVRHLIVVPAGALLSLPFGVLVTEAPPAAGTPSYGNVAWMARRFALTLAPSVQSLVNLRKTVQPSRASRPMIGFGDFVPNRDAEKLLATRSLSPTCRKEMLDVANAPALPGTEKELRAIAQALQAPPGSLILGEAFTEEAIKEAPLSDYRVVYFATHGLLPHELNCFSEPSLLTSRPGAKADDANDGLLKASEIVDLKLDANIVVLSACNTGGPGDETGGESLSGLARAFFYAGARSMLVTHWEIPDEPTVALMRENFAALVQRGMTQAEALQAGQLALMRNPKTAHPVNWGAFTVVGDGDQKLQSLKVAAVP